LQIQPPKSDRERNGIEAANIVLISCNLTVDLLATQFDGWIWRQKRTWLRWVGF